MILFRGTTMDEYRAIESGKWPTYPIRPGQVKTNLVGLYFTESELMARRYTFGHASPVVLRCKLKEDAQILSVSLSELKWMCQPMGIDAISIPSSVGFAGAQPEQLLPEIIVFEPASLLNLLDVDIISAERHAQMRHGFITKRTIKP